MANLLWPIVYITNQDVADSSTIPGINNDPALTDTLIVKAQYLVDDYIRAYWEPFVDGQAFIFPIKDSEDNSLIPDDVKVATLYIVEYLYQRKDIYQNSIDNSVTSESVLSHSVSYERSGKNGYGILMPDTAKTILDRYRLTSFKNVL